MARSGLSSLSCWWGRRATALRLAAEVAALLAAAVVAGSLPHTPQPLAYHNLADSRQCLGIPSCANVLSNAAFAASGIAGFWVLAQHFLSRRGSSGRQRGRRSGGSPDAPCAAEGTCLATHYAGTVLTSAFSAAYHLHPNNSTLVWDRLGIAVVFSSLLASLLSERRSAAAGLAGLPLLLAGAVGSVLHWDASERSGPGDMRYYTLMQTIAVRGCLYLVLAYPPLPPRRRDPGLFSTLAALGLYLAAQLAETFDWQVYRLTAGVVSGHTLKHLLAGVSSWQLVQGVRERCRHNRGDR